MASFEVYQLSDTGITQYENGRPVTVTIDRNFLGQQYADAAPGTLAIQPLAGLPGQYAVVELGPSSTPSQGALSAEPTPAAATGTKFIWSHSDTLLLIESFRKHQQDFKNHMLRKNEVWDTIAREMNGVKKVDYFLGGVCQKKWSNMEIRYKEKKDKKGKTGRGGQNWPYFDLMDDLLGCSASVRAVSSVVKPSSASVVQLPPASVCKPSFSVSHSMSSAAVSSAPIAASSSATQPSTSAMSLICPPSDSSDDELHNREAMNSISGTAKSAKRKKLGQGNSGWGKKLYDDMERWHAKTDKRLENLESLERERIGVLKEMKDLMKVWVDSVTVRQTNEI